MKKIVFTNHKGGVGKTTSALSIAQGLKEAGHRVLAIDLDPQANMTSAFIKYRVEDETVSDMLLGDAPGKPLETNQGIDLLPSGVSMARNEKSIRDEMQYETILSRFLKDLESKYDYCVMDCPPNLGAYTVIALMAADQYYIPLQPEYFGSAGLVDMVEFTEKVKKFNTGLTFGGIFVTRTHENDRRKLIQAMIEQLKKAYGNMFLNIYIRESVSIPESQLKGKSIYQYDPESNAAQDYQLLVNRILETQPA